MLKTGRQSKNIVDLRNNPKALAKNNLESDAINNDKLRSKTKLEDQEDESTTTINQIRGGLMQRGNNALNQSRAVAFSKKYNSQVTPGKFEMKDNLK